MAHFARQIDANHQVVIGNEGFWGQNSPDKQYNPTPTNNWSSYSGQNFTDQNSYANVTMAAFHYWPDLWVSPSQRPSCLTLWESWRSAMLSMPEIFQFELHVGITGKLSPL